MQLIDSHCHLEAKDFRAADGTDERPAVLARARQAGLTGFVCVGSGASLDEVHNAVAWAEREPDVWAAIGIHPHDVARLPAGALDEIERLACTHPRVVAVGETGLDYHYDHSPRQAQRDHLRRFAQLALRAHKPLSLHIRNGDSPDADAHADARNILVEERATSTFSASGAPSLRRGPIGGVVHCFTGTRADAEAWVALGFHVSFSGVVTFKSAEAIREACAWLPEERILVETDCPYLAPVPMRGKRNEPAFIVHTARKVAEVRGSDETRLAAATVANTRRLFHL